MKGGNTFSLLRWITFPCLTMKWRTRGKKGWLKYGSSFSFFFLSYGERRLFLFHVEKRRKKEKQCLVERFLFLCTTSKMRIYYTIMVHGKNGVLFLARAPSPWKNWDKQAQTLPVAQSLPPQTARATGRVFPCFLFEEKLSIFFPPSLHMKASPFSLHPIIDPQPPGTNQLSFQVTDDATFLTFFL